MLHAATLTAPLTLPLTLEDFEPIGDRLNANLDPFVWLSAEISLVGQRHRFDAIAVVDDDDGFQHAEAADLDAMLDAFATASGVHGPFTTVRLGARDYVLTITPFGA